MHKIFLTLAILPLIAGCSGGSGGLSTASLFGKAPPPAETAGVQGAAAGPTSTASQRALQVGAVSARAAKCGYNFDPAKLKANFLAAETAAGATPQDLVGIEKVYGVAQSGVNKAAASDKAYCTDRKTAEIKSDLARHLAGDYSPSKRVAAAPADEGLFSFGGGGGEMERVVPSTANGY